MATLLYDGECGFCTASAAFIERRIPTTATVSAGHAAIARLLIDAGGRWSIPGRIMLVPPFSWLAAAGYRLTAANRHRLPGGTAECALAPGNRPGAPV